jgi:hypothetical protein
VTVCLEDKKPLSDSFSKPLGSLAASNTLARYSTADRVLIELLQATAPRTHCFSEIDGQCAMTQLRLLELKISSDAVGTTEQDFRAKIDASM